MALNGINLLLLIASVISQFYLVFLYFIGDSFSRNNLEAVLVDDLEV